MDLYFKLQAIKEIVISSLVAAYIIFMMVLWYLSGKGKK